MKTKRCGTCLQRKIQTEFYSDSRDTLSWECKQCSKNRDKKYYRKNKKVRLQYANRRNERNQKIINEEKRKPCADCHVSYPSFVMDFDHTHGKKEFSIGGGFGRSVSVDKLLNEIAKCDVVCANCHRFRTFARKSR
jgi:hypothetical protein